MGLANRERQLHPRDLARPYPTRDAPVANYSSNCEKVPLTIQGREGSVSASLRGRGAAMAARQRWALWTGLISLVLGLALVGGKPARSQVVAAGVFTKVAQLDNGLRVVVATW